MDRKALRRNLESLLPAIGSIVAAIAVLITFAQNVGLNTSSPAVVVGIVTAAVVIGLGSAAGLSAARRTETDTARRPSIEARLEGATRALHQASEVMQEVERELRTREGRLEKLRADYNQAEELASINKQAAEAIRNELAQVVKGESRRSFWLTIAITVIATLIIGVVSGVTAILLVQHFHLGGDNASARRPDQRHLPAAPVSKVKAGAGLPTQLASDSGLLLGH